MSKYDVDSPSDGKPYRVEAKVCVTVDRTLKYCLEFDGGDWVVGKERFRTEEEALEELAKGDLDDNEEFVGLCLLDNTTHFPLD
jgi:hypothetical protein